MNLIRRFWKWLAGIGAAVLLVLVGLCGSYQEANQDIEPEYLFTALLAPDPSCNWQTDAGTTCVAPDANGQKYRDGRFVLEPVTYNKTGHAEPPSWAATSVVPGVSRWVGSMGWPVGTFMEQVAQGQRPLYYCDNVARQYNATIANQMVEATKAKFDALLLTSGGVPIRSERGCSNNDDLVMSADAVSVCGGSAIGCAAVRRNGVTNRWYINVSVDGPGIVSGRWPNNSAFMIQLHEGGHAADMAHSGKYGNEATAHEHLSDMDSACIRAATMYSCSNFTGRAACEDWYASGDQTGAQPARFGFRVNRSNPYCSGAPPGPDPTQPPTQQPTQQPTQPPASFCDVPDRTITLLSQPSMGQPPPESLEVNGPVSNTVLQSYTTSVWLDGIESHMFDRINQFRQSRGLPPVQLQSNVAAGLLRSAAFFSRDAVTRDLDAWGRDGRAHYDSLGRNAADRGRACGVVGANYWGEITAYGSDNVDAVFSAWVNSTTHQAEMLKTGCTWGGIGLDYSPQFGAFWTWSCANPTDTSTPTVVPTQPPTPVPTRTPTATPTPTQPPSRPTDEVFSWLRNPDGSYTGLGTTTVPVAAGDVCHVFASEGVWLGQVCYNSSGAVAPNVVVIPAPVQPR